MVEINRLKVTPADIPRRTRAFPAEWLTSGPAGKFVPIAAIPLLREDSLSASLRINVEMAETKELLMNGAFCRIRAFLIPNLALERFEGSRDQFDRSYQGEPKVEGGAVVPWIETEAAGTVGSRAVYKALGYFAAAADEVNTIPLEDYNIVWNYLAKQKSPEITPRTRLDDTLAPAFWLGGPMSHVVPTFDQDMIDGEVTLNVVDSQMPVKGIGVATGGGTASGPEVNVWETDATGTTTYAALYTSTGNNILLKAKATGEAGSATVPQIYAELAEGGITISLSNLELARKTQAWAKVRQSYQGHEEWIIDAFMSGLTMPDQWLKQPALLFDRTVPFAQAKRYATDSGNLADSAVSGAAQIDVNIGVPKLATGGMVMIFMECLPQQLFERVKDPWFHTTNVDQLPVALDDILDPEKVHVVFNGDVDTAHATPTATFGYEELNAKWARPIQRIGGKFMRGVGSDTVRKRLWANETTNPVLGADFYLATTVNQKPFLDEASDPFEVTCRGMVIIKGNTQLGPKLVEASDNYEKVLERADQTRLEGVGE